MDIDRCDHSRKWNNIIIIEKIKKEKKKTKIIKVYGYDDRK